MKRNTASSVASILVLGLMAALGGAFNTIQQSDSNQSNAPIVSQSKTIGSDRLARLQFKSGNPAYQIVNHNQSTLNAKSWQRNEIKYGELDRLNRTTTVTGYLEKRNLVRSSTRTRQTWNPTGWHQKRMNLNGKRIEVQNRGHLLAYSITGKFNEDGTYDNGSLGSLDNPKNLATQTEFSNQRTMQIFEEKVRNALIQNKKVIYQVTTIFKGNELMPRSYHVQAISTDKTLNFNALVWNVEPGVQFDYQTGRSRTNQQWKIQRVN